MSKQKALLCSNIFTAALKAVGGWGTGRRRRRGPADTVHHQILLQAHVFSHYGIMCCFAISTWRSGVLILGSTTVARHSFIRVLSRVSCLGYYDLADK